MSDAESELPKGWRWARLSEVGIVGTGNTPSKKTVANYGIEVAWVRLPDLNQDSPIRYTEQSLSLLGASEAHILPVGTVLISCIGTLGKVGILGVPAATNQQINTLQFGSDIIPEYGFYFCSTLTQELERLSGVSTVKIVKKSLFADIKIPVPPLPVQERIVQILQKADEIRRKRQEAVAIADAILPSS